ncbi:putative ATP-dependent endonuclease of OLD family [Catenulispora sp. GAS73]|uniref:ATP-dependent nuclease n=1 Tax=Catenulispora sp. GAS73 TaxID=3156269 RepID=UPI003517931D
MRLARVKVANYIRLQDVDIEVRHHLVLIGANDVGKTSLLRAVQAVLGLGVGQLYQTYGSSDLRDPMQPLVVEVVLEEFTAQEKTLFHREIDVSPDGRRETLTVRLEVALDEDPEQVVVSRWFPGRGDNRPPSREQMEAFGWRYLPATRGTGNSQLDGPASAMRVLLDSIDLGAERGELAAMLADFNAKLGSSTMLAKLREDVAEHLSRAMPRQIGADHLAVRSVADPAASVLGNVAMFLQRDDVFVALSDQSDGMRQLMSMTLFLLAQGTANVIAIDEPELHLHPTSQRTAANLFAGAQNQLLLVTHSPFVMERFEPSQVVAISPQGRVRQLPTSALTNIDKLRARWWSSRLLEALSARSVVLVEGVADRYVVEGVGRALDIGLDRLGCTVFDIDGADKFPNLFNFLGPKGFDVELFGLVDADRKNKWVGAFNDKPANILGRRIWVCDPDLEGEYCAALGGPAVAKILINAGVCKQADLLQTACVSEIEDITAEKAAEFCRKNKTETALAVGGALTADDAASITSVADMLRAVAARSQT